MLIDFSDLLEINVFVLGATYLKLSQALALQLPTVDPSLYISRFAALLEFGEETQKVAQDAVRLVARMGRDWMHIGRRPAGICGACLLLAARMNNFRRSVAEVIQVVKIADTTLRKRLDEFRDTPSGALTVADFRTLWLDETADPPAFSENQRREQVKREQEEEKVRRREMGENSDDDDEMTEAFAELAKQKEDTTMFEEEEDEPEPVIPLSKKALGKRKQREDDDETEKHEEDNDRDQELRQDPVLDQTIATELAATLDSTAGKALADELDKAEHRRATAAAAMVNIRLDNSTNLDDLDEDELDAFILTPDEVAIKSRVWMEANLNYLKQLADKQTGPDGELRPAQAKRVRKRNKPRDTTTALGTDAADATRQMLAKKRFSKKINYAAINDLFKDKTSERGSTVAGSDVDDDDDDEVEETPLLGKRHGKMMGTVGKRIEVPRPTFGSRSRAGTPARASLPPAPAPVAVVEEEEDDEEEDDEEEEQPQQEEEGENWRHLTQQGDGDEEEDYGYGDEI